ncbi:hypothetical protein LUZ63_006523 [Rhynchospora breviuscula]|uniref:Proline-rich protein PRCC n=2 Tax=Mesangiospermae TaxID=1437183 RepID=A0A9Q0CQ73_9POAL|nr:hypothetical protein LUZ63_006523 [Rhynchospora breviuscula]
MLRTRERASLFPIASVTMDSLLANYASSSDDEGGDEKPSSEFANKTTSSLPSPNKPSSLPPPKSLFSDPPPQPKPSLFSSLPPPKSNDSTKGSIFSSLPAPKSKESVKLRGADTNPNRVVTEDDSFEEIGGGVASGSSLTSSASIFSSLPPPKSSGSAIFGHESSEPYNQKKKKSGTGLISSSILAPKLKESTNSLGLVVNPKKVVHFTTPINPNLQNIDDEDDEEESKKKNSIMEPSFTTSSNLSSMLPAPKNSLCLAPPSNSSNLFSSRKSNLDTKLPAISPAPVQEPVQYETNQSYDPNWAGNVSQTGFVETSSSGYAMDYGNAENYAENEGYGWSTDVVVGNSTGTSVAMEVHDLGRARGKRGRNEMPPEIVEVKQDELMKNRPRQDQVKLTGIAFGPSYQPATSSKEKPSKLHKRKHQIGSLLYDMKQKEMELAERRAKGFLTKAETQAKYGW